MPISSFAIVSLIACELNSRNPATVLDMGCGNGFYGAVVRTYVDLGYGSKTKLTGVEPFIEYKENNLGWRHYNYVFISTAQDWLKRHLNSFFDFILFLDVIEHMPRAEGLAVLEQLQEKLTPGGVLIVSTPGEFVKQGAEHGNELERHVSFYDDEDFLTREFILLRSGKVECSLHQRMTVAKYIRRYSVQ